MLPSFHVCFIATDQTDPNNGWFKYVKHTLKPDPSILARRRDTPQGLDMI